MHVVIVGAGEVGSYVARILVEEGHDVAVIEIDEVLARKLDASLDALVVHGSGISPSVLQQAGIGRADLLLAVTAVDEVNLIACMTALKFASKRLRAVARVRQSRHMSGGLALSAEDLGLDALVSPEEAVAESTVEMLRYAGSGEMREIAGGKLLLVGMELDADSPLVHGTLAELRRDFPKDFAVVAVQGPEGVRVPRPDDRMNADDRAFVLTLPANLTELAILSGQPWYHVRRILVVGCGNTGLALARELERQDLATTVIESDGDRAELVAGLLPRCLVLHADGSDPEFLRKQIEEERIDAVLVLLKDPEKSVLIGIFAKSLGARKVIVRCDKPAYVPLANRLGIDAVISPKRAMTDAILRYVRRGKVGSALLLGEHEVEILGFKVPEKPRKRLVGRPLAELELPEGALIGAVIRDGEVMLAAGDTLLRPGDELFVACRPDLLERVERLLS